MGLRLLGLVLLGHLSWLVLGQTYDYVVPSVPNPANASYVRLDLRLPYATSLQALKMNEHTMENMLMSYLNNNDNDTALVTHVDTAGFEVTTNLAATNLQPSLYSMLDYVVSINLFLKNATNGTGDVITAPTGAMPPMVNYTSLGLVVGQMLPLALAQAMFGALSPSMSANNVLVKGLGPVTPFLPSAPYIGMDLLLPAPADGQVALDAFFFQSVEFAAAAALLGYHATWVHVTQAAKASWQPLLVVSLFIGLDNGLVSRDSLHLAFDSALICAPIFEANDLTFLGSGMYTMNLTADGAITSWYSSAYSLPSPPNVSVNVTLSFGIAFSLRQVEAYTPAILQSLAADLGASMSVVAIECDASDIDTPTYIGLSLRAQPTPVSSEDAIAAMVATNSSALLQDILTALQLPAGMVALYLSPAAAGVVATPSFFDFTMTFIQVAPTTQGSPVFDLQRGLCALAGASNRAVLPSQMKVLDVSKPMHSYTVTWTVRAYLTAGMPARETISQLMSLNAPSRFLFNNRPDMSLLTGYQGVKFNLGADGYVSWFNSVVYIPPVPLTSSFARVWLTFDGSLSLHDLEVHETALLSVLQAAAGVFSNTSDVASVHSSLRDANAYGSFNVSFRLYAPYDSMLAPATTFYNATLLDQLGSVFAPNPVLVSVYNYSTSTTSSPEPAVALTSPYFDVKLQYYDANPVPLNTYDAFFFQRIKLAIASNLGWNSTSRIITGPVTKASGSYLVIVTMHLQLNATMDRMALSGPLQTTLANHLKRNGVGDEFDSAMLDLGADGFVVPLSFYQASVLETPPDAISPNTYLRVTVSFANVTLANLTASLPTLTTMLGYHVGANATQIYDIHTNAPSAAQAAYYEARLLLFTDANDTQQTTNMTSALVNPAVINAVVAASPGLPPFGLVGVELSTGLAPVAAPIGPYVFLYLTLYQELSMTYSALDYARIKLAVAAASGIPSNAISLLKLYKPYNSNAMQWTFQLPLADGSNVGRDAVQTQVQLNLPQSLAAVEWPTAQTILGIQLNLYADGYTTYEVTSSGDLFVPRQSYPLLDGSFVHVTQPSPPCNALFCLQLAFTSAFVEVPYVLASYETKRPLFSNAFAPGAVAPIIDASNATVWQIWPSADSNPSRIDVVLHLTPPGSFQNASDDLVVRVIAHMMSPTTAASSVTVVSHSGEESVNYYSAIIANNVLSLNLSLYPASPLTDGGNQTLNLFTLPSEACALCQNLLAQSSDVYCIQNQILTPNFLTQTVQNYLPGFTRDITQALLQCQNTTSANAWADFQIAASCFLHSGCPLAPFLPNTTNMAVLYSNDPSHAVLIMASTYELQLQIEFNGIAITPLFTETSDVAALSNTLSQQFAATGVVPTVSKSWNPSQNAWTIQIAYQNLMSSLPILSVYNPNARPQPPVSISTNVAPYYAVEVLPYNTAFFSSIATGQSAECAKANAQLSALSKTYPMAYDCLDLPALADQMARNATLWYNNSQWDVSDMAANCLGSLPPASAAPLVDVLQSFMESGCPVAQVPSGNITLSQPFSSRQLIRAPQGSYVSLWVQMGSQSMDLGNIVASTDPKTLSMPLTTLLSAVTTGVRVQIYSTPEFDPISQEMSVYWYILLQYKDLVGPLPHLVLNSNAPVSSTDVPAPLNLQLTFAPGPPPPGPTASGMGLTPIPECRACSDKMEACRKSADCSGAFACMANSSAIFDNPSILLSTTYPMGYTANLTSNFSSCYAQLGVSFAGWQQLTSALRCYMNTSCPITEDVSSTRMVSLQPNNATQTIQMQTYESVTLMFSVKGVTLGALYNVSASGSGFMTFEAQLWFLSNFTSSIRAYSYTTLAAAQSLWTLELTYGNFVGPLPTIQVYRNYDYVRVSSPNASVALQVVPYNLKYFAAGAPMPMDMFKATNMTSMCDQCRAFLQTYCGPDPSCQQLMTDFQRNMNQTILSMINAGNGSFIDVSDLIARSVPAGTPARAASVFGLYHSCLSQYQCPLVKTPPNAPLVPVLVASTEKHVAMIYNTSAAFNLTVTYPAFNVTMAIDSSMSPADLTYALASQWNASMPPTASLGCSNLPCYLTFDFAHAILPLTLPDVVADDIYVSAYKKSASQVLQLFPSNTTGLNLEIAQSPACNRCLQYFEACYSNLSGCTRLLSCANADSTTQQVRNGSLDVTAASLYAKYGRSVAFCLTDESLAMVTPFLAASSCLAANKCPVNVTLSQISAGRSLVPSVTPGYQKILVSGALTASVSLDISLLGAFLGRIESISLYSSSSVLASQLQAMFKSLGTVSLSTSQETNTMWYIQLTYSNYIGPLPTLTIATSSPVTAYVIGANSPSQYYEVVPLHAVQFGFPYQAVPTQAPMTTSPAPMPTYGTNLFPSGTPTNNTATTNATKTMATVCDQCEAYLKANCLTDTDCTYLLSSFRAAINANVSALLVNSALFLPMSMSSVLLGPQTPFTTTSLKSMTRFALYYSCMSNYQCALNSTMVNGIPKNVVLSMTPEVHVVTVPNTTVTFNTTISYPSLNVSLVVTSSASSGLNYAFQSVWGVSLTPTAVLACDLSCNVTLTFPNLAIPLSLPRVTSPFATTTATRTVQASHMLMLLLPTTVTKTALVLSATCNACVSQFSACTADAACANILSCWRANASIASTLSALQASPQLSSVNATANATLCFANQTFASASPFLAATSCLLQNGCPVAADLSLAANITSILAYRMIVPTVTTAIQTIFLDTTKDVTLQLSLFGSSVGSVSNVALATPTRTIAALLQTLLGGMGQVTATSASTSQTSWSLTLSYANYVAPLPTITVLGAFENISSAPSSWLYKVVPLNISAFGFPYTSNWAMLSDSMQRSKCQACASLASQCAMSTPCASIVSCVGNQTTGNFTTALASGDMESSLEYTSAVASCTANVAYTAWWRVGGARRSFS
ncbi:hypothetical protein SDRG_09073 [Saprolegnia diclina VS20]|uniref:Secreted protein n=1 Tax=Saprolegnia diclina (strain VS20) TaxID=1156394 RepID=T0RTF5_SAPDV|nr:hypothetical protein SDRG_09073 [Saprolegnia diclina VS20]EQC33567.1 hypothetical protein SDRG_09073 [Saprolegnia diclina VS20]|eukprot:XP_008613207.1 hypothetical protein SDRG_09073 [Saprolegnia diclina VS20]